MAVSNNLTVNRHIAKNDIWTKCRKPSYVILPKKYSKIDDLVQNAEFSFQPLTQTQMIEH
jgi:hypothetical protein